MEEEEINIPVIVLTAKGGDDDEDKAKNLGAKIVMTKPFSPKHLIDTIKNIVGE
eukprot:TRINITY_DN7719_c0_g1_i1.p1 TRINITY_DN7719_c0_g1~~TRINITY_DN7719_c0_g1_i1.p1  ORF type:complete len:54 (+),score=14.73 TRINITY_DN7719_c0_g1_i1:105-266(+)